VKLLVAGAGGQVGRALARAARPAGFDLLALAKAELDITDRAAVDRAAAAAAGGAVINAAAYTAVDRAEVESELAYAVNARGAENLARACAAHGARLVHISTDYVFDGSKIDAYATGDPVSPLGAYGRSKAAGEVAVGAADPGAAIVRTSWVFGADGRNFATEILRLAGRPDPVRVVADQRGCPTSAGDLARALLELAARPEASGLFHFCGDGETTRHGFAEAIVAALRARGGEAAPIEPIAWADIPGAARRPANAVLDTSRIRALGIVPRPWREGLDEVVGRWMSR